MTKILKTNPLKRPTIEQLLEHPWLKPVEKDSSHSGLALLSSAAVASKAHVVRQREVNREKEIGMTSSIEVGRNANVV